MKGIKNIKIKVLIVICMSSFSLSAIAQTKAVNEILKTTQDAMKKASDLSCNMNYKWYDTYTSKKPSLTYNGQMIKHEKVIYSKINQTFFITDENTKLAIKCNELQKALEVTKINESENQSPWDLLDAYIDQFKIKKITDQGNHWICTLTTDVITQLPYGKVEIYINKQSNMITKQVVYFLSQVQYKNEKGEKSIGNPKMEIILSDYKTALGQEEKKIAQLNTYIKMMGKDIKPAIGYKNFEIIHH